MAKILFDIKYRPQIESGEYTVENRNGVHVTILEWDIFIHGMAHMMLIRYDDKYEFVHSNGRINRIGQDSNLDLFIVTPEEEFTEWEKSVGLALTDYQLLPRNKDGMINIHDFKEFIKERADKLLSIARKQAEKDLTLTWEDMAKIDAIIMDVNNEFAIDVSKEISRQKFYEAVLKRFNELKK